MLLEHDPLNGSPRNFSKSVSLLGMEMFESLSVHVRMSFRVFTIFVDGRSIVKHTFVSSVRPCVSVFFHPRGVT